jgi:FtsZ-binding cell division protein ZapB
MEGIYLLCSKNTDGQFVYKVGRSKNIYRRLAEYPPNYEILLSLCCPNSKIVEKNIIGVLNSNTELGLCKYDNGNEYFKSLININVKLKTIITQIVNVGKTMLPTRGEDNDYHENLITEINQTNITTPRNLITIKDLLDQGLLSPFELNGKRKDISFIFLTYVQDDTKLDKKIIHDFLKNKKFDQIMVAEERTQEGKLHHHALCYKKSRMTIYHVNAFDIEGDHPHIMNVKKVDMPVLVDYLLKECRGKAPQKGKPGTEWPITYGFSTDDYSRRVSRTAGVTVAVPDDIIEKDFQVKLRNYISFKFDNVNKQEVYNLLSTNESIESFIIGDINNSIFGVVYTINKIRISNLEPIFLKIDKRHQGVVILEPDFDVAERIMSVDPHWMVKGDKWRPSVEPSINSLSQPDIHVSALKTIIEMIEEIKTLKNEICELKRKNNELLEGSDQKIVSKLIEDNNNLKKEKNKAEQKLRDIKSLFQ